ncbi:hypothetical protein DSO57_1009177 [Entomophthora muscae]|uniref:Uncharacterized protein n=1 Tax=Entomophthora muscae TaxID=34485 RepID=A0ACC2T6Z8_9FUNG|nr:hypothetical protein DSO57_1009177 [Entomophthora muscae]
MERKPDRDMTLLEDQQETKPISSSQDKLTRSSDSQVHINCQDDLLEKIGLKDFYQKNCLPYIGENPSVSLEPSYSSWIQELPGPHDTTPDTFFQELVMGPEPEITPDLFQQYKDHEYAKILDLKRGPIPDFDTSGWMRSEAVKKAAPINYLGLPLPSLAVPPDAEVSSPKSSSGKEDGFIDIDDSYQNSDKKSKKKKKKRKYEKDYDDGDDKKKKKKKKKKSKSDRHGTDEE